MSGKYTGRKLVEVRADETRSAKRFAKNKKTKKKRKKCWSSASLAKTLPSPLSPPSQYHILVTFENCQASIWHRYSGFRSFYELFVLKHGADEFSMFPRRHLNKWSKAVTSERLVALDAFLRKIVENPKYRQDPLFKDFLSVDENARRQFYEPSATQNHDIEIRQLSKEISNIKSSALANFKSSKKKSDKTSDEFREKK
jgi:hypothetical protein